MTSGSPGWTTLSGSRIGSVHVREQLPNQDAVLTWAGGEGAVVAVADGHGHRAHFRSDTGSAMAVVSAVEELRRALPELARSDDPEALARATGEAIVATWRDKVLHHAEAHPFTEGADPDTAVDKLLAYGSTFLAAAVSGGRLVVLQLGDGDSVVVGTDGVASRPLPEDPDLDGVRTSSLCQPDPLASLRVVVLESTDVAMVYLCTDGFGGSRVDVDWWQQTGAQLVEFSRGQGLDWVRERLPEWLEEPARIGGDDTTMAILARSDLGPGEER